MKVCGIKHLVPVALVLATCGASSVYAADPESVSASDHDGNIPENTLDNNLATRWSAEGDGQYLRYDLGESLTIESVDIAFFRGNERLATFDVQTSEDEQNWTTVFSGTQAESTTDLQNILLVSSVGRYVQIVGYGNSSNSWNSITEVDINTPDSDSGASADVVATASVKSDDASRVIDGDFDTRWSTNVAGAWLQLDLGEVTSINGVELAFRRGDERSAFFSIETSEDGSSWEQVFVDGESSGDTLALEQYDFSPIDARYVRFYGDGNSTNGWSTVTEFYALEGDDDNTGGGTDDGGTDDGGNEGGGNEGGGNEGGGNTGGGGVTGDTYTATLDSLEDVLENVSGGDEVIVTGSGEISLSDYNFSSTVLIRAEEIGGTTLTNATISDSNNIALQGFVFGPSEESTLLKIENSTNIQVLRNLFDHRDVTENQTSIVTTQASQYIEIAYNEFRDKNLGDNNGAKITGSFIKTQFDDPLMTMDLHIHHNHFNNIAPYLEDGTPAGDSDREAIAMGIADSQDVVTNNVVEYNLFENCDGENEIVTVKTSNNIFRYNTFKNSLGSLSFRLGSNNEAYGNYFYGEGSGASVSDDNYQTGGIRIYGSGHVVYDNYMENLTGVSWRRPILIDSGDTSDSTGNDSHERSTNIDVYNNIIINSVGGGIHIGSDNYGNQPTNISVVNNIVSSSEGILFNNHADNASNVWTGNQAYVSGSASAIEGGALGASEVEVLSGTPSVNAPTALSSNDVGRFAD